MKSVFFTIGLLLSPCLLFAQQNESSNSAKSEKRFSTVIINSEDLKQPTDNTSMAEMNSFNVLNGDASNLTDHDLRVIEANRRTEVIVRTFIGEYAIEIYP